MKKGFIAGLLTLGLTLNMSFAASILSSHILDISEGKPAPDVTVVLEKQNDDGSWKNIETNVTDNNGRLNFLDSEKVAAPLEGIYRLKFETAPYFKAKNVESFYPYIEVIFDIKDATQHYHVPITLSPFGYSTYRGS